jgi:hypothetical protein
MPAIRGFAHRERAFGKFERHKANRVRPTPRGTPRCGVCHRPLPRLQSWVNSQLTLAASRG